MKWLMPVTWWLVALLVWPGVAGADSDLKVSGAVVSGGPVTLPLAPGAPAVTLIVSLGLGTIQVPVSITPLTLIEAEEGVPITLVDGDRVEVEAVPGAGVLVASKVEVEDFPEVELRGVAQGLPPGGGSLPVAPGGTLDFALVLIGVSVPVRVTGTTRVEAGLSILANGAVVKVEGSMRDGRVVATQLEGNSGTDDH
jgi:hypothetical protein